MYCYCEATKRKLREWLARRYETPEALGRVWNRYRYTGWDDVEPPSNFGGYPESLDWLEFRVDDAFDLFHWRIEIFAGSIPST
jgi:beta-galactosidase GanA